MASSSLPAVVCLALAQFCHAVSVPLRPVVVPRTPPPHCAAPPPAPPHAASSSAAPLPVLDQPEAAAIWSITTTSGRRKRCSCLGTSAAWARRRCRRTGGSTGSSGPPTRRYRSTARWTIILRSAHCCRWPSRGSPSLVAERAVEGDGSRGASRRRDTRDRAARSREARGHRHVVTAPRAGRPKRAPYVRRRGVRVAPAGGARRFARARRRGTERARREERRRATRDSRVREPRLVRLAGSHARAAVHRRARLRRGARRARRWPSRAAARGRDASARVFAPQPDGDASDADVSEAPRLLDVLGSPRRLGG